MPARVRRRPTDGSSDSGARRAADPPRRPGAAHPGARAPRAGDRGPDQLEGQGEPDEPDEVPGHRPAHARRAVARQGRHRTDRSHPRRAAQAARRHRHDPRADRRPRHEPAAAARRRRAPRRGRPTAAPRLAARVGRRARRGGPRRRAPAAAGAARAPAARGQAGHAAVGAGARPRQPLPRARPDPSTGARLPAEPARRLGAARPALPRVRARRRRRGRLDGAASEAAHRPLLARRDSTSWCTSRASSRACRRGTAPSCSPTSRASARRPSRCWLPRSRTPTRCSPSCPTS